MYYKYDDLSDNYHRLQHEYNIFDNDDNLIHKYLFNKDTYYDESLDPILHTKEDFCLCFKENYKKIKLNLQLHRINRHGKGSFDLEIDSNNDNYINITYLDKNNDGRISTNTNDISSNSGLISTNTNSISANLGLISTNTNSISANSGLISTNTDDISANSGLISANTDDISANTDDI